MDDHVAGLAVLARDVAELARPARGGRRSSPRRPRRRASGRRLSDMPAVDGDVGGDVALDRLHGVEGHAGIGDERAARLDRRSRLPAPEDLAHGGGLGLDVGLDRRRLVLGRVGDAEAAAEVVDRELAEAGDRLDRLAERAELEDLRADVHVQAAQLEAVRAEQALDGRAGVVQGEAELRVQLPGGDEVVRARLDPGRDADAGPAGRRPRATSDSSRSMSSKLSITMCPTPASIALAQLALGLRVAVEVDARGFEATAQREVKLAARRGVAGQVLLARTAGRPRCRGRPWRRTRPRRRRRGASRAPRGTSAPVRAGRPRRSRRRGSRTRAPARRCRSRRPRAGRPR